MNQETKTKMLNNVSDPREELWLRLQTLTELGRSGDKKLVPDLKLLLKRKRPPHQEIENWDPRGAERVIDLHIIRAIGNLGDYSEIHLIGALVKEAGTTLEGPYDELENAATTILSLGQVEPIHDLIRLTSNTDPSILRNAVTILDRLNLPAPPTGQNLESIPEMAKPLTYSITRLKEEMETICSLSHDSVRLSPGVSAFLDSRDYNRGKVTRQGVPLAQIIKRDFRLFGFLYYIKDDHVVVCTYSEASLLWQSWWQNYGGNLQYRTDEGCFVLRGHK